MLADLFRRASEVRRAEQKVAAAEANEHQELWRTTLASIGDAVISTDVQGRVTFLNPVAERLTGWALGDARRRPLPEVFRIVNESTRSPVENPALRALQTGTIVGLANHTVLIARDGAEYPIDDSAAPIRDASGAVSGAVLVFRDITDRRRAERDQARLAAIVESSNDAIISKTLDGVIQTWNGGAERVFGYTAREMIGRSIRALLPPERLHEEDEILARVRRGERIEHFETVRVRKCGTRIDISVSVAPLRDAHGDIVGASKTARDITDRKAMEQRLRESEERFRSLFESMDEGYCVVEPVLDAGGRPVDYRYLLVNPAVEAHTGLRDAVGKTARQFMPTHESHWIEAYARVAATGEPVRRVDRVADLNRWFDVSAFRVGPPGGRQVGVLFTDVTARKRAEDALVASERQLAEVFEHSPSFVAVVRGPEHVFERTNPQYQRLVGDRAVIGRAVRDAFPEVVDQGFVALLDGVYRTGEPYIGSGVWVKLDRGNGRVEERNLDFVFQPVRDPSGAVAGIIMHGADRTERVRAEALLREKEVRLNLLLGSAADYAVIVLSPEGLVLDWLGGAETITGFTPGEVLGGPADVFYTPEDRAAGVPAREREAAAATGRAEDKRWHQKKGGEPFFADGVTVALRDGGTLRGFGKVFRDATARKRAEDGVHFVADATASLAELVDYRSTLERIANLATGGFADWCVVDIIDEGGTPRRLTVTAREPEEVAAARAADAAFQPADARAGAIPHVLKTGEPEVVPDINELDPETAAQGKERVTKLKELGVRSYLCMPLLSRGRALGGITFLAVSPRRRFGSEELRVARSLAERVTVAIENAQLYRTLQEQDRRKDEFLATLAHELRNPLAPVRNGVQILRAALPPDPRLSRTLGMMERQLGQMVHLVDDLMDVSRVSSGKVVLRRERVSLRAVVDAAVETSRQLIEAARHELVVQLPPGPVTIDADHTRTVQVLANLLNNAAKYTPHGGRIVLTAEAVGGEAVVRVADTGVGIPADMLPRVFDMFTQVGTSLERSQGGLGIGLTLVRRLVEMHGGSVTVESPGADRGSTFTVRLPMAEPALTGGGGPSAQPGAAQKQRALEVLVVDDNRDSAESLAMLLELRGHHVRTAHDGPEALRLLASYRPQLILLDLGLPGMSGYEVAGRIRQSSELRSVRMAALTGWGQEEDRRRTKEAGFDHHLVKPADVSELDRILESVSK
ncbi:PAS domain S-box protein [Gemmata sp. JC673]|uniref:histidine kinase n=1 Tax=Gemmata algarum TaxID=2975278 RepID=A0ABU5F7C8_9BACT|nr:PAS domain S-box protein [Gemmata algarum]